MGETSISNKDKINIYGTKKNHNDDIKIEKHQDDHNVKRNYRTSKKYVFQKKNQISRD